MDTKVAVSYTLCFPKRKYHSTSVYREMYKRMLNGSRILVFILLIVIVSGILWYIYPNDWRSVEKNELTETLPDNLEYKCCTPFNTTLSTNLFFLKTHKTGSSTIANIIMRFAERYSLSVLSPMLSAYYEPFSKKSLYPKTITPDNKYNILASHMRYTSELKSYQYPETMMITVLRHPATLFQSAYIYFRMDKTTNMTFEQFVKAPIKPSYLGGVNIEHVYKGYNSMSVDLGFDLNNSNDTNAIREFVAKIDREFDFVMITEHMDASLVLLANAMGWPLEYVAYLTLNAKPPPKHPYTQTEQDKLMLMELNRVDASLYQHFLEKFLRCVQRYGEDEINAQVFELREMNRRLRDKCVLLEHNKGHLETTGYILRDYFDAECLSVTRMYG